MLYKALFYVSLLAWAPSFYLRFLLQNSCPLWALPARWLLR